MEYKNNLKYFKQNYKPIIFGIVLLAIGVIVKIVFSDEHSWEIRQMYTLFMLAGAICIVLYFIIRPKDSDLETQIRNFTLADEDTAKERAEAEDKRGKVVETFSFADYVREDENLTIFRGTDGTVRTNRYSSSVIVLTTHRIYIYRKMFSITEENVSEEFFPIEYTDVNSCSIVNDSKEYTFGKKSAIQEITHFQIDTTSKNVSLILHSDSFADDFCDRLNRKIAAIKNQA